MEEIVCLQFWWSEYSERTSGGRIISLFFSFFHRVFITSLSSCFFLRVFIASLSISLPLYFYLHVLFNFNQIFFVIYNQMILNGVVALSNNVIYLFLTYTWLNFRQHFFLTWQHLLKGFCYYIQCQIHLYSFICKRCHRQALEKSL